MVRFSSKERTFINEYEVCRMATIGNDKPHVVPICYVLINDHFYLATDYDTKKYNNLLKNRSVALAIDVYQPNKAVIVEGEAEIVEEGKAFREIYDKFYKTFAWVRATPWKENEAPFIKVKPLRKISWGL
ncbi:MAG: pyridoxamine 5'-phosphate oxidase family protein [Nitrososphaerales archaeon]